MPPDRRYTTAELDALAREESEQIEGMDERRGDSPAGPTDTLSAGTHFARGAAASVQRTLLGLKQIGAYLKNDDPAREKVNDEIKRLEEEYADSLDTPIGKVGEAAGTMAQFAVPGGVGMGVAKVLPRALVRGAELIAGAPGSARRGATTAALFESAQPVKPGDLSNESLIMDKVPGVAAGAAIGGVAGRLARGLTTTGPPIEPERRELVNEAKRLKVPLSPAQRTGDITLAQLEEGMASRSGSANVMRGIRQEAQDVLNRSAVEALGRPERAPTEGVLAAARESAAEGYKPIADITEMSWDAPYMDALKQFIDEQGSRVLGSPDAAVIANKLLTHNKQWTGSRFLEDLQGVRDLAHAARTKGDVHTARQLSDLGTILEEFAGRRVEKLADQGKISADAMQRFQNARTQYGVIHAIEKATDVDKGNVNPVAYLKMERRRRPASAGRGTSALDERMRKVGDVARVLKQTAPYISSSGTAERIAGQQLAEAMHGPLQAWRAGVPTLKNYLTAQLYLLQGGRPGPLGSRLSPRGNMMVRRLLPGVAVGAGEGLTE